jgi:predicted RNA binding protein YcfA (HicA-like mRNA interferase family)
MPRLKPVSWQKFEKFLLKSGCKFERQKGDHRVYSKQGLKRPIIIPAVKELPRNVILSNLRTLGISKEDYLRIITKH